MKIIKRPRWRYDLASEYFTECGGDIKRVTFDANEDFMVKRLTEYLCEESNRRGARVLRKAFPYVYEAHQLYNTRTELFSEVWILEALAVAGVPPKDMIKYLFYDDPKIVNTYCLCFFDVRDKDIKMRYSNNIRLLCNKEESVRNHDFGWKKAAVEHGAAFFINTVLNRKGMGQTELELLSEDSEKLAALTGHWNLEKRHLLIDKRRSEEETLVEKQNIDINLQVARTKNNAEGLGNVGTEIVKVLDLVSNQIELSAPTEPKSAREPRLIKKRDRKNGKNVKKQ